MGARTSVKQSHKPVEEADIPVKPPWQTRPLTGKISSPWEWDGKEWSECKPDPKAKPGPAPGHASARNLTVLTWNIWYKRYRVEERMKKLVEVITTKDPDLIALQEVTLEQLQMLLDSPVLRHYYCSTGRKWPVAYHEWRGTDEKGETKTEAPDYAVVLFSKIRPRSIFVHDFHSRYGRKAVMMSLPGLKVGEDLCFGSFHLESLDDAETRQEQMELCRQLTKSFPNVIWAGDTNVTTEEEIRGFGDEFLDVWSINDASKHPGHTFDADTNAMCTYDVDSKGRLEGRKSSDDISLHTTGKRPDRVLISKNKSLETLSAEVVGAEKVDDGLWISDHFGLFVELKIK